MGQFDGAPGATEPLSEIPSELQHVASPDFSTVGLPPPPGVEVGFVPTVPLVPAPQWNRHSFDEDDVKRAQFEFVNPGKAASVWGTRLEDLVLHYGFGYYVYFDLLRLTAVFTVFVFLIQLVPYAWFLDDVGPSFSKQSTQNSTLGGYNDFFITNYSQNQEPAWYAVNIIMVVAGALFAVGVSFYFGRQRDEMMSIGRIEENRFERAREDRLMRYKSVEGPGGQNINVEDNCEDWSAVSVVLRCVAAVAIFAAMVTATVLFSYYGTRDEDSSIMALLIAVLVQVLNSSYFLVAEFTTRALPIRTWSGYTKIYGVKLVLFRISQQVAVFASKSYKGSCAYYIIGEQFYFILLTDLVLGNLLELFGPWIVARAKRFLHTYTSLLVGTTSAEMEPQFVLSVEYLEYFGRMYVLLMASVVFPFASLLVLISLIIDYWLDKFRLMKLAAAQRSRLDGTQRHFVMALLLAAVVGALATPYAGVIWVLSGETQDVCTECVPCRFP